MCPFLIFEDIVYFFYKYILLSKKKTSRVSKLATIWSKISPLHWTFFITGNRSQLVPFTFSFQNYIIVEYSTYNKSFVSRKWKNNAIRNCAGYLSKGKRDVQFYYSFSIFFLNNYRAIFHTKSSMHLPQKSSRGWISETFGVWKFLFQHDSQNSCRSCTKRMSDTNNIKGIGVLLLVPIKCFCQQMLLFQTFVNIGCSVWHALWMKFF